MDKRMTGEKLNQTEKIKFEELSKKYFWEQKTEEIKLICSTLLIVLLCVVLAFLFGVVFTSIKPVNEGQDILYSILVRGFLIELILLLPISLIWLLIDSNKETAKIRAMKDLGYKWSYLEEDWRKKE